MCIRDSLQDNGVDAYLSRRLTYASTRLEYTRRRLGCAGKRLGYLDQRTGYAGKEVEGKEKVEESEDD